MSRKLIVDYIEAGTETDLYGWKNHSTGGSKKYPITAFVPEKNGSMVQTRFHIPLPNCKLEEVLKWINEREYRMKWDNDTIKDFLVKKQYALNTSQVYIQMKTPWPVGDRDMLLNTHVVEF